MSTGSSLAKRPKNGPRPRVNRSVKPRKPRDISKAIIAIDKGDVMLEDGQMFNFEELPLVIRTQPSSIIVAHHFGDIVRYLDSEFKNNPLWQFRASPVHRTVWAPNRERKASIRDCTIGYLGFKGENKRKGHYHYPLSPHTFCLKSVNELRAGLPERNATIVRLLEWAKEVREFLVLHKLNLSPTSGGIAAQLLRDKRFYPDDRRKVPKLTNARARSCLPGNYYKLYNAKPSAGKVYKAAYLDQVSAHHSAAASIQFPNANTLTRKGRYSTLEDRPVARYGSNKFDTMISEYGLFYLAIETPMWFPKDFPLPACEGKPGYRRGFFYSNEIPYLLETGVRIRHIIACWTSPDIDPGLNVYAEWAARQIKKASVSQKPWLKPTLLSTYGVLAAKPKVLEFGYRNAVGGTPKRYPCGNGFIDVQAKTASKMCEPVMANVIHRGLIEAETRLRSLKLARELAHVGHSILAIYADSVFVEDTMPLPLLPPPWRVQDYLTRLRFQSSTHFTSTQISKTPGIPLDHKKRIWLPPRPRSKNRAST